MGKDKYHLFGYCSETRGLLHSLQVHALSAAVLSNSNCMECARCYKYDFAICAAEPLRFRLARLKASDRLFRWPFHFLSL